MWEGGGWLKMTYGRSGLAENVKITSYGERGSEIAKKRRMIFEPSLRCL